jgi:alpha-1,2-mannosyltransferase
MNHAKKIPGEAFLNSNRLRYALIVGATVWAVWLASILLGTGIRDVFGQVIGNDFLAFYTGGKIVSSGQSANLYDLSYQYTVQHSIFQDDWSYLYLYVNPPFYAWLFVLFAQFPYRISALLWMGLGLAGIGLGVRWLHISQPMRALTWGLTFFPVFAGVSFGQNASLSLALFCLIYALWRRERCFSAGLASSLLLYKPQLLIGMGFLWLLDWKRERNTLAGLIAGGIILVLLCFLVTPQASLGYIRNSQFMLSDSPIMNAYATRTFWLNLLPGVPVLPYLLYILCVVIGICVFIHFWQQKRDNKELLFGAAICLTLWVTPHVMVYDWNLLLIPAIFLWEQKPGEHPWLTRIYALVWAAVWVSGPLTMAQLKLLPFSVQISLPIFALSIALILKIPHEASTPLPVAASDGPPTTVPNTRV